MAALSDRNARALGIVLAQAHGRLLLQSILDVLLAGLHHLLPHTVGAAVAVEECDGLFASHDRTEFAGELAQVRRRNLRRNFFAFLLSSHALSRVVDRNTPMPRWRQLQRSTVNVMFITRRLFSENVGRVKFFFERTNPCTPKSAPLRSS